MPRLILHSAASIAERVLARYEDRHPESKAIGALGALGNVGDAQKLPFWFFIGSVPFATTAAIPRS